MENAAVEPRRALINNLLIYAGLSLKRRLQATEGCRRRADKTHPGGPLSAGRLPTEAIQERTTLRRVKKKKNPGKKGRQKERKEKKHPDPSIFPVYI